MTTYFSEEVKCGVCNKTSLLERVASTSSFGSSDLDTRSPEPQRETISAGVECCEACGYCAPDLGEATDAVRMLVRRPEFSAFRGQLTVDGKAADFLVWANIAEQTGQMAAAAWATIQAAWCCDDAKDLNSAIECRKSAARRTELADRAGQPISSHPGASEGILTDLLRRAGCFDEARACASKALEGQINEIVGRVLRFELCLIDAGDVACHTVKEAMPH